MIKCEQCEFFKPTPLAGAGTQAGQCRHDPPRVIPIPTPQGINMCSIWPTTQGNEEGCSKGSIKVTVGDID